MSSNETLVNLANTASTPALNCYIHKFLVRSSSPLTIDGRSPVTTIEQGLQAILSRRAANDPLNALLISAQLDVRSISLIRTYCSLLWQLRRFPSRSSIQSALTRCPLACRKFWAMFEMRFNPAGTGSAEVRKQSYIALKNDYLEYLQTITDVAVDRVLRALLNLVDATVRTNFYLESDAIAIKLNSELVPIMPQPRPKYEIFISSPDFEATHLRSDTVARGGIRWSDRRDDFRSEVLGLMKTQKIKNAVIVPSGAKGGFVLLNPPADQRALPEAVADIYKRYIRTLLSITDNRVGDKVVHPPKVICLDAPDPYLVVAADKGTATFSDLANTIAVQEFNFWLGDAFASGGSQGYDHKLYGITARGAWESVKRHFNDMGVDCRTEPITVVGVGDMSGDVFGNGLLLSRKLKLLAAFDHRHIFVDPNPDPEISFRERERLFNTPRSQWSDYDGQKISTGGGVFGRQQKEIKITAKMRTALALTDDIPEIISGDQLVSAILRAKVDLLWNGGIGTYVKARNESHSDVGDGSNDAVRVNADELRAKVVGEGGNLGFTQRARIEFASRGGRINTDAIDNSGGVDLSDHEVNLKILFAGLLRDKKLTIEERNNLLKEMSAEVVESVLEHNRNHALLLTLGVMRSSKRIDYFRSLVGEAHRLGYIDRGLEQLPDDQELLARARRKEGLTRPELAVCLAAVKMWVKRDLIESELIKDPLLQQFLLRYFPKVLQDRFRSEILNHPLAANITASQLTNYLIDLVGISFVRRLCLTASASPTEVIKYTVIADQLMQTGRLKRELTALDSAGTNPQLIEALQALGGSHRYVTFWLISTHSSNCSIAEALKLYQSKFEDLLQHGEQYLQGEDQALFQRRLAELKNSGMHEFTVRSLSIASMVANGMELIWIANQTGRSLDEVGRAYYAILDQLKIAPVTKLEAAVGLSNRWEKELITNSYYEIRHGLARLTARQISKGITDKEELRKILTNAPNYDQLASTISDISLRAPETAAFAVLARKLDAFEKGL